MSAVQGQSFQLMFVAVDVNAQTTRQPTITWANGDVMLTKPGGAPTASTNLPTHRGGGRWQLNITAAEMGLGLTDGQVGELLVDMANVAMIPILGLTIQVAFNGPGTLTAAAQAALVSAIAAPSAATIAAAVSAPSSSAIATAVDAQLASKFAAIPSAAATASAVDAALANDFAAIPSAGAIAAAVAAPSSSTIAVAVDAQLAARFTTVNNGIAGVPAAVDAPTAQQVALAVVGTPVDGTRTLGQCAAVAAAEIANPATLPTTAQGGPITIRNAANTKNMLVGTIDASGVRTYTVVDLAP